VKDFLELVKKGTPNQVQEAIEAGADLRAQDKDGWTPLMYAAKNNPNPEVITTLLKAGADSDAQDKNGVAPISWTGRPLRRRKTYATDKTSLREGASSEDPRLGASRADR
jgi:ankyrin repeat protein